MGHLLFATLIPTVLLGSSLTDSQMQIKIARIASEFGDITGIPLQQPPVYVRLPADSFQQEVETIAGPTVREQDRQDLSMLEMLFDPATNRIVRARHGTRIESLAKVASEIPGIEELLLAHETAHAWQKQVLSQLEGRQSATTLSAAAVLEGHAEWLAGEYARRNDLERPFRRIREGRRQTRYSGEHRNPYFLYEEGYEFWRYVNRHHSSPHLSSIWLKMPSERQVAYPAEYMHPTDNVDLKWLGGLIETGVEPTSTPQELGFLAFRKYAASLSFPDAFKAEAIAGYLQGLRFSSQQQQASVLAFASPDQSRLTFQYAVRKLDQRAQQSEHPELESMSGGLTVASYRFTGSEAWTSCLMQNGRILCELEDRRPFAQTMPLKEWRTAIVARLARLQELQSANLSRPVRGTP